MAPRASVPFPSFPAQTAIPKHEDCESQDLSEDAIVWKVYAEEATKHDEEMLHKWNGSLDTLLIFAGLFSAVATALIIESYRLMVPDYTELTYRVLSANTTHPFTPPSSFRVSGLARTVNGLWISSLVASLFTALVCILAKQWLAAYPCRQARTPRAWAETRQIRLDALIQWRVPEIIATLPVLLHVSLLLFFAGLVVFLALIDGPTATMALVVCAAIYILYVFAMFSPLVWPSSPFRTSITPLMQRAFTVAKDIVQYHATLIDGRAVVMSSHAQTLAAALSWLGQATQSAESYNSIMLALGDIKLGPSVAANLSQGVKQGILTAIETAMLADSGAESEFIAYFRTVVSFIGTTPEPSTFVRETVCQREHKLCLDLAQRTIGLDPVHNQDLQVLAHAYRLRLGQTDAILPETFGIPSSAFTKASAWTRYPCDFPSVTCRSALELFDAVVKRQATRQMMWSAKLMELLCLIHCFVLQFQTDPGNVPGAILDVLPMKLRARYQLQFFRRYNLPRGGGCCPLITVLSFVLLQPGLVSCTHSPFRRNVALIDDLMKLCSASKSHTHKHSYVINAMMANARDPRKWSPEIVLPLLSASGCNDPISFAWFASCRVLPNVEMWSVTEDGSESSPALQAFLDALETGFPAQKSSQFVEGLHILIGQGLHSVAHWRELDAIRFVNFLWTKLRVAHVNQERGVVRLINAVTNRIPPKSQSGDSLWDFKAIICSAFQYQLSHNNNNTIETIRLCRGLVWLSQLSDEPSHRSFWSSLCLDIEGSIHLSLTRACGGLNDSEHEFRGQALHRFYSACQFYPERVRWPHIRSGVLMLSRKQPRGGTPHPVLIDEDWNPFESLELCALFDHAERNDVGPAGDAH